MAQNVSRYQSAPKRGAPSNPIVLGARSAFWVFWIMASIVAVMIASATYWLLTHPVTA